MSTSSSPAQTKPKSKRSLLLRRLFLWLTIGVCLLVLGLFLAYWQRKQIAQFAITEYLNKQGWQASVYIHELNLAQGGRLSLDANRQGAQLAVENLHLRWQWRGRHLQLLGAKVLSMKTTWDERELSWQELRLFGKHSQTGEKSIKTRSEQELEQEGALAKDGQKRTLPLGFEFSIANDFAFILNNLKADVTSHQAGQDLHVNWQSGVQFTSLAKEFLAWELAVLEPSFEGDFSSFGQIKTAKASSFNMKQSSTGLKVATDELLFSLVSLPKTALFSSAQWQGGMELLLNLDKSQELRIEGKLTTPTLQQQGLSALDLEHKLSINLQENQAQEATAQFRAKPFTYQDQSLGANGQLALIWEEEVLSALGFDLSFEELSPKLNDQEKAQASNQGRNLPWRLTLQGAKNEQQGGLDFSLRQGSKTALLGEGSWDADIWRAQLEGQMALQSPWISQALLQFVPAKSPLQMRLTPESALRIQEGQLQGKGFALESVQGQVQLSSLHTLLGEYDAGLGVVEAAVHLQPNKGVKMPQLRLSLPALDARGALQIHWGDGENDGENQEQQIASAAVQGAAVQVKGRDWQIALHELSPLRQYHPALEVLDGNARLDSAQFVLELPRDKQQVPQLRAQGKLSQGQLNSAEPLYSLSSVSAPALRFAYGESWALSMPLIQVGEVDIQSKLQLEQLRASLELDPKQLSFSGLEFLTLGGTLNFDDSRIPLPKGAWETTLRWKEVDLAKMAKFIPKFDGALSGRVDGYLPLAYEGFSLKKEFQGGLSLSPGTQTRMSIKPKGVFSLSGHPDAEKAEKILEDYIITELDGVLRPKEDKHTLMHLRFQGRGDKLPEELSFNIPVTTDQPEQVGSLWKWVSYLFKNVKLGS